MTAAAPRTCDPRECKALTFHDATPREIIARVHGETVKALASAEVKQRLAAQGFDAEGNTPEQFTEVIRRDLARWQKVIADAKIRVE